MDTKTIRNHTTAMYNTLIGKISKHDEQGYVGHDIAKMVFHPAARDDFRLSFDYTSHNIMKKYSMRWTRGPDDDSDTCYFMTSDSTYFVGEGFSGTAIMISTDITDISTADDMRKLNMIRIILMVKSGYVWYDSSLLRRYDLYGKV